MKRNHLLTAYQSLIISLLFIGGFVFFFTINRYQLGYQEQITLFRLNAHHFREFALVPGGLSDYAGVFFTQFFLFPVMAALIVTGFGFFVFALLRGILRETKLRNLCWSMVPVLLLFHSQANHNFRMGYAVAFLLTLLFLLIHMLIKNLRLRMLFLVTAIPLLYYLAGGFFMVYVLAAAVFEFLSGHKSGFAMRFFSGGLLLFLGILVPYGLQRWVFNIPASQTWTVHFPLSDAQTGSGLVMLAGIIPAYMLLAGILQHHRLDRLPGYSFPVVQAVAGTVLVLAVALLINIRNYDRKTEMILAMDHAVQGRDWDRVLAVSREFPGSNLLVTYYTNLALSLTGRLADQLFSYNQVGVQGLNLPWKSNTIAPLFGGEVYYYLGYTNEAYRWAFEAMEAAGVNPRSLKRLAVTSLINDNPRLAKTWLNVLDETLFYRKWSAQMRRLADDSALAAGDPEIGEGRKRIISKDFWADDTQFEKLLNALLQNHPGNKTAWEYFMCYQLLEKDPRGFMQGFPELARFGYKAMPRYFQEAFLAFRGMENATELRGGLHIDPLVIEKSRNYMSALQSAGKNLSAGQDRSAIARSLQPGFGDTFWYYFHFFDPGQP